MVAHPFFFSPFEKCLSALGFKIGMFENVVGSHSVQYEFGFVGNSNYVIFHGVGQKSTLVDQFNESQTRVFLKGILPFLRAQKHDQFDDARAVFKSGQT